MLIKLLLALLIPNLSLTGTGIVKGATVVNPSGLVKVNLSAIEPIISAPAAVAIDVATGKPLFQKHPQDKRPIASLTKLITAYTYLKKTNSDLKKVITLEESDKKAGSVRKILPGEQGTALDFLKIALVASDNNAAVALARAGGFLDTAEKELNESARELGLKATYLKEPSGLEKENVSTAMEVAKMARRVFKNQMIQNIVQQKDFFFTPFNSKKRRLIKATNELLKTSLFKVLAGKTGYTPEAGYCLVLKAENQQKKEIIVTVLGAESSQKRFQDAKAIAWWVFENYE
jgi:D-alanyl-D-alanine endopeptidase (penicillin-binding protein 7)